MKGKIDQWKDDKGFGFIKPENGSERIFFHISSVKTNARRPQIGDTVLFESIRDSQQRLKAKSVVIEGVTKTARSSSRSKPTPIEPPSKNVIDYLLMLICICSLAAAGLEFYRSKMFEIALLYGVPAVVAFLLLNRQKKPKDKSFRCSGCKKTTDYEPRTIQAWNRGFTKLYCKTCHHEWLKNNPHQDSHSMRSKGSGCLGTLALMIIIPTIGSLWLYHWLA
ncbi:MAG: cold shock CspA family protein [Desulforhopalus sp.]|jgi:cold shock CspA family protein